MIDNSLPEQLGMLNPEIGYVFGQSESIFVQTTARRFLFDGVPMCVEVNGTAEFICDLVKSRELNTMKEMPDGRINFSMFGHVSI